MKLFRRFKLFIKNHSLIPYVLIFILAILIFGYLQSDQTFADPDSFYHAKMAQMLYEKGIFTDFPWLSATTLKYNFTDHHFLYHLLLIPFVLIFSPLVGTKIATILFASVLFLVFYWLFKKMHIKGAFWYTLFLMTVNPFIFRINLAKAQSVVLIFLFIFLYLLFHKRFLGLIFISALYTWLYAGWPLLLLLTAVFIFIDVVKNLKKHDYLPIKKFKSKIIRQDVLIFLSVFAGIVSGIFFSPYFPKNLSFFWQQSFKIAVINYQYIIDVGGEWYPYKIIDLILAAKPLILLFLISVIFFVSSYKKQSTHSWFFFVVTFIFFGLTLKSRRNVEYFMPFAVYFSAISISNYLKAVNFKPKNNSINRIALGVSILALIILTRVFYLDLITIKNSYRDGFSFSKFEEPSRWLKENTTEGTIVFHSDWDEFPILFYHNDHNRYIVGLDPTFMYEYNKKMYDDWVKITLGEKKDDMYDYIKKVFGADYVFVDAVQNKSFDRNLSNNFYFTKVFENEGAKIYKVAEK